MNCNLMMKIFVGNFESPFCVSSNVFQAEFDGD